MSDLSQIFGAGFDTNSVPPQDDFDVLPPGKYPVMIEKAEVKQTKAGTGYYISLALIVLDGPAKNRKLWDNINIANPSDKCVEIGLRQLAAIGKAVGLQAITDTSELLNRYCLAHVKVKDNANEIRTYSAFESASAPLAHLPSVLPAMTGQGSQYCPRMPMQNPYPVTSQPGNSAQGELRAPPMTATSDQPGKPPWAR